MKRKDGFTITLTGQRRQAFVGHLTILVLNRMITDHFCIVVQLVLFGERHFYEG